MPRPDPVPDPRRAWEPVYRAAVYRMHACGAWRPLSRQGSWALVTAWNPASRRLPRLRNQVRDAALKRWLDARGVPRRPARGASRDGRWHEDGWLIPHRCDRTRTVLRCFGQHAAWVVVAGRGTLFWS